MVPPGTYLQFNVLNIFNQKYLGSLNTTSTNNFGDALLQQAVCLSGRAPDLPDDAPSGHLI